MLGYRRAVAALGMATFLATVTIYAQLRDLNHISALRTPAIGLAPAFDFLDTEQTVRHQAILERRAGNPWQYRVLATYLVETLRIVLPTVPLRWLFLAVRWMQNLLIFVVAGLYFSRLGLRRMLADAGLAALAWSMCWANYNAGLAFDTYFDLLFYLVAASLIAGNRPRWILPISLVAAANRETSLLMPFLVAVAAVSEPRSSRLALAAIMLAGQLAVVGLLHLAMGPQPLIVPEGHAPGLALLGYNLGRAVTWLNLGTTFLFIPVVALAAWHRWPAQLRRSFLVLVPAWVAVHFVFAIAAEPRLFLVPYAIVLLPGALAAIEVNARA
jgi:hypothetical protein